MKTKNELNSAIYRLMGADPEYPNSTAKDIIKAVDEYLEGFPAPTGAAGNETPDWSAEMDRINATSKAAMEWINKAVGIDGIFVGGVYVAVDEDTVEVRQIKQGRDGVPILNDVEMEPIHAQMDYSDWVFLAEFVQKAIAERSNP